MSKETAPQLEREDKEKPGSLEAKAAGLASKKLAEAVDNLRRDGITAVGGDRPLKKVESSNELAFQTKLLYKRADEAERQVPEGRLRKGGITLTMPKGDAKVEEVREEKRGDFDDKNPAPQGRWVNHRMFDENTEELHTYLANGRSTKIVCENERWDIRMHGKSTKGRSSYVFTEVPRGSDLKTYPDGTFELTKPDKTKVKSGIWIDGSNLYTRTEYPNGKVETKNTNGTLITEEKGVKTTKFSDDFSATQIIEENGRKTTEVRRAAMEGGSELKRTVEEPGKKPIEITTIEKPNGTRITKTEGKEKIERPYLDKDGKPIGYLVVERGPNSTDNRTYDDDPQGKIAEKKKAVLEDLQRSFKGITFSSETDRPETFGGKQYSHRSATLRELEEVREAALRTCPAIFSRTDGQGVSAASFVFLNTDQIKNEFGLPVDAVHRKDAGRDPDGYERDGKQKIYLYSSAARLLAMEDEHTGGGNPFFASPYRKLVAHELIHNEDKRRDPANADNGLLCSDLAKSYGFERVTDSVDGKPKWAVIATNGDRYVQRKNDAQPDNRWFNASRPNQPPITVEELHPLASVKFPTYYSYTGPQEANAECKAFFHLSPESNKKLEKEFSGVFSLLSTRDSNGINSFYQNRYKRDARGYLVPTS
jgi:hypothetical protein